MKKKVFVLFAFCLIGFLTALYGYEDFTQKPIKPGNLEDPSYWFAFDDIDDFNKSFDKIAKKYKFPMKSKNTKWRENFIDGKYTYPFPKYIKSGEMAGKETETFNLVKKYAFALYFCKIDDMSYSIFAFYLKNDELFLTATIVKGNRQYLDGWDGIFYRDVFYHKEDDPILVRLDKELLSIVYTEVGILTDEEQSKKRQEYKDFLQETYRRGKTLYEKEILPLRSKMMGVPISISSYKTTVNSAGGVDVKIKFENLSDKVCKYIEFDITPYNKVDDIVYDDLGDSRKTIKHTGFVQPKEKLEVSTPRPIWYSYDISYIKINTVKITYSDNSVDTIGNIQNVLNAKDNCVKTVVLKDEKNLKITANYDFYGNSVYIDVFKDFSVELLSAQFGYAVIGSSERYLVDDKFVDTCKSGIEIVSDHKKRFSLSSVLWASAKSISFVHTSSSSLPGGSSSQNVLYEFSEDDIRHVKDFACICYYCNEVK